MVTTTENLPDTIALSAKSLKIQEYKLLSTPYGFFLIRVTGSKKRHKVVFEESRDKLVYLIDEEKKQAEGKPDSIRALEYYKKHSDYFRTPDTILSRAWLVPFDSNVLLSAMSDEEKQNLITSDTSNYNPLILFTHDLPVSVSTLLLKSYHSNNKRQFIGPLCTELGRWYFSINSCIHGNKSIPFTLVKDFIFSKLEIQSFPFDKLVSLESGKKILENELLSKAYCLNIQKEIDALSAEDYQNLLKNKLVQFFPGGRYDNNTKILSNQKKFELILERDRVQSEEWINKLSINRTLLFSGGS